MRSAKHIIYMNGSQLNSEIELSQLVNEVALTALHILPSSLIYSYIYVSSIT